MSKSESWCTEDFDAMSWHDVHVHGFNLGEYDNDTGTAELYLDIDYILEWRRSGNEMEFVVAQAMLQVHEIFGLKLLLDYATPTAGMVPFSLAGIQREEVTYETGSKTYNWRLEINWPRGFIEFRAPGFTQNLIGEKSVQSSQYLEASQRNVGGVA